MADGQDISALAIAEELLDITGEALLSGDFHAFAAVFHLPNTMTTLSGTVVVSDLAHLRRVFDGVREKFRCGGVTNLVRYVDAAKFRTPTQIASTHVSHLMSGSSLLEEPYPVFSIIELVDGVWKGVSSDYAVKPRGPQDNAILGSVLADVQREFSDAEN